MAEKKRILFVLGEREVAATSKRMLYVARSLVRRGFVVDLMTESVALHTEMESYFGNMDGMNCRLVVPEERFWTMRQRDEFAKTFIKLYHDIELPFTDMKFWKQVAFDDFLWNVSRNVFPRLAESYDLIMLTVPSMYERPSDRCDILYTSAIYHGKENQIPVMGIQIYPVVNVPALYLQGVDCWVVDDPEKQRFFVEHGVPADRVHLVDAFKDAYCISTIDDSYKDIVFQKVAELDDNELGVVVVNHPANRFELKQIVEVLGDVSTSVALFFAFIGTAVRELHEMEVFNDLLLPTIESKLGRYYGVEVGGLAKAMMICDVMVSTNYILPLSFAGRYGKQGIVYDRQGVPSPYLNGVAYAADKAGLAELIEAAGAAKRARVSISDIVWRAAA